MSMNESITIIEGTELKTENIESVIEVKPDKKPAKKSSARKSIAKKEENKVDTIHFKSEIDLEKSVHGSLVENVVDNVETQGQTTEIKTNENQDGTLKEEEETIQDIWSKVGEIIEENSELELEKETYKRVTRTYSIGELIKMYIDKDLIVPDFQRLYVWKEEQRNELMSSIFHNLSCGCLVIAADKMGKYYLLDGLQRLTSCLKSLKDEKYFDRKKDIMNYEIAVEIMFDLSVKDMRSLFKSLNSGVTLAMSYKELSKLDGAILEDVNSVTRLPLFEEIESNKTFSTQGQHINIALNAILAYSSKDPDGNPEFFIGERDNRMKYIMSYFNDRNYFTDIKNSVPKSIKLLSRIKLIYDAMIKECAGIKEKEDTAKKRIRRSYNSNFWSVMVYIMANNDWVKDEYIINIINYIFAAGKSVTSYSNTVGNSSNSAYKNNERKRLLEELLNKEHSKNTEIK